MFSPLFALQNEKYVIKTFIEHQTVLLKFAWRLTKNTEVARDILQNVAVKLLDKKDFMAENEIAFIKNTIKQVYQNYITVNKKYIHEEIAEGTDSFFDLDIIDSIALKQVKAKIHLLSEKQQKEIMAAANGFSIIEQNHKKCSGSYESSKTHKRLGILNLRKILKEE